MCLGKATSKTLAMLEKLHEIARQQGTPIVGLTIDYKEMGEFAGDVILPVIGAVFSNPKKGTS